MSSTNTSIAEEVLGAFNDGISLASVFTEEVVLDFPYGPTLQLPSRIVGRQHVAAHLERVWQSGLRLRDIAVVSLEDGRVLATYIGIYRSGSGQELPVPLVAVIGVAGTRVASICEYWDTKAIWDVHNAPNGD